MIAGRLTQLRAASIVVTALGVAACGGGGGGGGATPPAPPPAASTAPQFSQHPGSRAVAVGTAVSFSAGVVGSPTAYQWRRNDVDIPGATAPIYTLTVASADEGARFSVRVANSAGSATSSDARLTVFPLPAASTICSAAGAGATAFAEPNAVTGKSAGAAIAGCSGALSGLTWTQTAGAAVALLAHRSQAISFEPPGAGSYAFQVAFTDPTGAAQVRAFNIVAAAASAASTVNARLDRAVRGGGAVSVRAWPQLVPGDSLVALRWQQLEGPAVSLDTRDERRILFTAPTVVQDTLLRFRVTMTSAAGTSDSDDVYVLVESSPQGPPDGVSHVFRGVHVSRVHPFLPAGPYAGVLVRCVYDAALQWQGPGKNLCPLSTLPYLHQETGGAEPTVAQIMNRVAVSHDWMADVFQQFIGGADKAELRRLLNAVTAVVIGANVRPSFYDAVTGAIYLDADDFWLSPEQRDVVNEAPDFRSAFDRELAYSSLWRYTSNGVGVLQPFPAAQRDSRDVAYLLYEAGWLMYHELAHANDFLPLAARAALNSALAPWDNVSAAYAAQQLPSDVLAQQLPLASAEMKGLAQVKFFGALADGAQKAYTAQQVWGFFGADRASDEYAYATTREDAAMLFEEFMMSHRHGLRRDMAVSDKVTPGATGDSVLVRGGQRGRVGDAAVKPRVQLVIERLAPWVLAENATAVSALPAPLAMRAGESWNANLSLPAPMAGTVRSPQLRSAEEEAALLQRALRRHLGGRERVEGVKP